MSDLSYEALLKNQQERKDIWGFLVVGLIGLSLAVAGWQKLRFGLSFIDEGMYLTDGWRLANGDNLFPDANRFAASFYHVFLSWVFYVLPDAGVLSIRKVQFFLNLLAISTLLYVALRDEKPKNMLIPLLVSTPFLYLGLDPTGMGTSLNYYTITSFFFLLHMATVIAYVKTTDERSQVLLALLAGLTITAAGISYLAVGAAGVLFLLLPLITGRQLTRKILVAYLLPALLYPLLIYPNFEMHWQALQATLAGRINNEFVRPYTIPHLLHAAFFVGVGAFVSTIRDRGAFYLCAMGLMAALAISLETRGLKLLPLFWNGWFKAPGLVASINAVAATAAVIYLIRQKRSEKKPNRTIPLIMLVGFLLYASLFALTSSLGILLMLSSSVILWIALGMMVGMQLGQGKALALTLAFAIPCASALIEADYKFTYFDKSPDQLDTQITEGPAVGIQTNEVTAFIESTIRRAVAQHTDANDLILSFDQTPMVYFLSKRRPAVDHSWIGITGGSEKEAKEAIQKMIVSDRLPKLALHWQNKFLWVPTTEELDTFALSSFSPSLERPILEFVQSNMTRIATINIGEFPMVEIFKMDAYVSEQPKS